jgi:hypothetical protein
LDKPKNDDEPARVAQSAEQSKQPQEPRAATENEPEPVRPNEVHARSTGWAGLGENAPNKTPANNHVDWANEKLAEQRSNQPDSVANTATKGSEAERLKDKAALAADLKEAKDGTASHENIRGRDREPNHYRELDNLSVKAVLAADLEDAKESTPSTETGRDGGRTR